MPVSRIQVPDGRILDIEHPAGASERDLFAFASMQASVAPPPYTPEIPAMTEQEEEEPGFFEDVKELGQRTLGSAASILAEAPAGIQSMFREGVEEDEELVERNRKIRESISSALGYDQEYDDSLLGLSSNVLGSILGFGGATIGAGATGAALGSAIFPGAGTLVGGVIGLGTGALLGAGSNVASGMEETARQIERGQIVTDDDYESATARLAGIGASEGLPFIGPAIKVLRRISGAARKNPKAVEKLTDYIRSAAIQGTEEAAQEALAGIASDAVLKEYINPDIEIGDSLGVDLVAGGLGGALFDVGINLATRRRRSGGVDDEVKPLREELVAEEEALRFALEQNEVARQERISARFASEPEIEIDQVDTIFPEAVDIAGLIPVSQVQTPEGRTLEVMGDAPTDPEIYRGIARDFVRQLGDQFPTELVFEVKEIKPGFSAIVDDKGKIYGTTAQGVPTELASRLNPLAVALNAQTIEEKIYQNNRIIISESKEDYTPDQIKTLQRLGRIALGPESLSYSSEAANYAGGTTEENGFLPQLSPENVIENNIPRKKQTIAQRINVKRIKNGQLPTNRFALSEIRREIGADVGRLAEYEAGAFGVDTYRALPMPINGKYAVVAEALSPDGRMEQTGEIIYDRPATLAERQAAREEGKKLPKRVKFSSARDAAAFAQAANLRKGQADIPSQDIMGDPEFGVDKIKELLRQKNISSDINSKEIKSLAARFTGNKLRRDQGINALSPAERQLLYQKLRQLPRFESPTKIPEFRLLKPKEPEAVVEEGVQQEPIAALPSPSTPAGMDTATKGMLERAISSRLKQLGLSDISGVITDLVRDAAKDADGNVILGPVAEDADLTVEGGYTSGGASRVLQVAMDAIMARANKPEDVEAAVIDVLNHEVVHALRNLDVITQSELQLLERLAGKYRKVDGGQTYVDWARSAYEKGNPVMVMEEAIAEMIRDGISGRVVIDNKPAKITGKPRAIFNKIVKFFKGMFGVAKDVDQDYASFTQFLNDLEAGRIGERERGQVRTLYRLEQVTGQFVDRRAPIEGRAETTTVEVETPTGRTVIEAGTPEAAERAAQTIGGTAAKIKAEVPDSEVLMEEAGLNDLMFSRRIDRAEEQGFDTSNVYYHGSMSPDIKRFKATTGMGVIAGHFTRSPRLASTFVASVPREGEAGVVYPVFLKKFIPDNETGGSLFAVREAGDAGALQDIAEVIDKPFAEVRFDHPQLFRDLTNYFGSQLQKAKANYSYKGTSLESVRYQRIADRYMGGELSLSEAAYELAELYHEQAAPYSLEQVDREPRLVDFEQLEQLAPYIKEAGFAGYRDIELTNRGYSAIALFNPADVKGVFADYDPAAVPEGMRYDDDIMFSRRSVGADDVVQTSLPVKTVNKEKVFGIGAPSDNVISTERILLDPKLTKTIATAIRSYNFLDTDGMSDLEAIQALRDHAKRNLIWLHGQMDPEVREIAKNWYDGARKQVDAWTEKYGIEPRQVAAVIANLSPQKDWFMNMSLAERVLDTLAYQNDFQASDKMNAEFERVVMKGNKTPPTKESAVAKSIWDRIKGAKLSDVRSIVGPKQADLAEAIWVRMFDEAYNPRSYRMIAPTGQILDFATNEDGSKSKVGWGSFTEIAKAVGAARSSNLEAISRGLGNAHKVRNFYNNIVSPNSTLGEVTIDTHAVAAALFKPLSGKGYEVFHAFGTTPPAGVLGMPEGVKRAGAGSSGPLGVSGTYGIFADAYRDAARELGLLPRELQSITWEEIRAIFPASFKDGKGNLGKINALWDNYAKGDLDLNTIRNRAYDIAGTRGNKPVWFGRSRTGRDGGESDTTYDRFVSKTGISRQESVGAEIGRGGDFDATSFSRRKADRDVERSSQKAVDDVLSYAEKSEPDAIGVETLRYGPLAYSRNAGYSNQDGATPTFTSPSRSWFNKLVFEVQDKLTDLRAIEDAINESRKARGLNPIPVSESAYIGEETIAGKIAAFNRAFEKNELEPLIKEMSDKDVSIEQMDEFLVLRHAIERNERIRKINPSMPDAGSGKWNGQELTDNYVKSKMLADFGMEWDAKSGTWKGGNARAKTLSELASRLDKINSTTLAINEKGGLITEQDRKFLDSFYKYYTPLRGISQEEDVAAETSERTAGSGGSLSTVGKETKRAMGRATEAVSPMATIISSRGTQVARAIKNTSFGNRLVDLIKKNPNDDVWQLISPDDPKYKRMFDSTYTYVGPDSSRYGERRRDISGESDKKNWVKRVKIVQDPVLNPYAEELLGVKVDGQQYYVLFNNPDLRKAAINLDAQSTSIVMNALSSMTRWMSYVNTSLNPEFVVGNFARDVQTAIANIIGEQTMEDGKALGTKKMVRQVLKRTLPSIKVFYKGITNPEKLSGQDAIDFNEFIKTGSKTDWFHSLPPEQQKQNIAMMIEMANGTFKGNAAKGFSVVKSFVDDTNNAVENGVRLATFVAARDSFIDAGIPRELAIQQASTLAKNLTVNFNRRGNSGQLLNSLYLFFNASVQGTVNTMRGLNVFDPNSSRTKQGIVAAIMGFGALMAALGDMALEDDEFEDIEEYIRDRNIVIPHAFWGGDPKLYSTIPLPYGYNVFYNMGENAYLVAAGKKSPEDAAVRASNVFLGSFSPLGTSSSETFLGSAFKTATPQFGKPLVELVMNENYFGSPIYPPESPYGVDAPASRRSFSNTAQVWKNITETLASITGGNESEPGLLEVPPDSLSYLLNYGFGGAGSFVERTFFKVPPAMIDESVDLEVRDIPFVRRVLGEINSRADSEKFYERRETLQRKDMQANDILRGKERNDYLKENSAYMKMVPILSGTDKNLRELRRQLRQIKELKNISPQRAIELANKEKLIQDRIDKLIDRFNSRYDAVVGKTK